MTTRSEVDAAILFYEASPDGQYDEIAAEALRVWLAKDAPTDAAIRELIVAVNEMHAAYKACDHPGFYADERWNDAYDRTRELARRLVVLPDGDDSVDNCGSETSTKHHTKPQ